jgi:PKD repeat protein
MRTMTNTISRGGGNPAIWVLVTWMTLLHAPLFAAADFTASVTSGCRPLVVTFTDQSSPTPISWEWTFNGGEPNAAGDHGPYQVTYNTAGTFTVKLIVETMGPLSPVVSQKTMTITVYSCSSIGDRVWLDKDMDGIQHPDHDQGVPDVTVRLYKGAKEINSTITDQIGWYEFSGLQAGTYGVLFVKPQDYAFSPSHQGNSDELDSDADPVKGASPEFTLYAGVDNLSIDAGMYRDIYDYGDAPAPYPTLNADNGARHRVAEGLCLGTAVDDESDGRPDPLAQGDDNDGTDDEDGVIFDTPLIPGKSAQVTITATGSGKVQGYIDMNRDGDWNDPAECIIFNMPISGTQVFGIGVPFDAVKGVTFARFRITKDGILSPVGDIGPGEVEDYKTNIGDPAESDFGDAPDGNAGAMTAYASMPAHFPTAYNPSINQYGPVHWFSKSIATLGNTVTIEQNADSGIDEDPANNLVPASNQADMDGGDDGTGMPNMLNCLETHFKIYVNRISTPAGGIVDVPLSYMYINVWFDWNRDGDWNDTLQCTGQQTESFEWAVRNLPVKIFDAPTGIVQVTSNAFIPWHPLSDTPQPIWMRMTLAEVQWDPAIMGPNGGGSGPEGGYKFGETEDYCFIPEGGGPKDFGDAPAPYPTLWSENGASDLVSPDGMPRFGSAVDAEPDGQPSEDALGDDNNGADAGTDSGIQLNGPLIPGDDNPPFTVNYTSGSGGGGRVRMWIDWNQDGLWNTNDLYNEHDWLSDNHSETIQFGINIPWDAPLGVTYVRFRNDKCPGLAVGPGYGYGEVEDVKLEVGGGMQPQYGNAPSEYGKQGWPMEAYPGVKAHFPTQYEPGSPHCGPVHWWPKTVGWLGASAVADSGAGATDLNCKNDAVSLPLILPDCVSASFDFKMNARKALIGMHRVQKEMYFNAWFDWNRDGDWDDSLFCSSKQVFTSEWAVRNQPVSLVDTDYNPLNLHEVTSSGFLPWQEPAETPQPIWMRIMLSETMLPDSLGSEAAGPAGGFRFGETEDYFFVPIYEGAMDFGDAPDPKYPTMLTSDGARHVIVPGFHLGSGIDPEYDGLADAAGAGDDSSGIQDDDGILFKTPLVPGDSASIDVKASQEGILNAWVDFNADGDWKDAGERIFIDQTLASGVNAFEFQVPSGAQKGATFGRFRFGSEKGLGPSGPARNGEVEDYMIEIKEAQSGIEESENTIPKENRLLHNYPNPFNPSTKIEFELNHSGPVRLTVYSVSGREIAVLCDELRKAGRHSVTWDGRDKSGNQVSGGVYLYRIEAGNFRQTKKLLMMK